MEALRAAQSAIESEIESPSLGGATLLAGGLFAVLVTQTQTLTLTLTLTPIPAFEPNPNPNSRWFVS